MNALIHAYTNTNSRDEPCQLYTTAEYETTGVLGWAVQRLKLETRVSLNRLNFLTHGTVLMLCWTLCFQNILCPTTDL